MSTAAVRIVVTVADPARQSDPDIAVRKNALYAAAIARAGGDPILLDASADATTVAAAFASMDALVLSGGADVDPARYGRGVSGAVATEPERDRLEAEAWAVASARAIPVLGICRGMQAINVFAGGTLLQDVDGHAGAGFGAVPPPRIPFDRRPAAA